MDCDVIVWSLKTGQPIIRQLFGSPVFHILIHPSGCQLVLGFVNKIALASIYQESIRVYKDFHIENLRAIRLSSGGQYIAVLL